MNTYGNQSPSASRLRALFLIHIMVWSGLKAMGFDEVRVRYRQQRRRVIREVIVNRLVGSHLNEHVDSKAKEEVPEADRQAFIEDVLEDLKQMDESRLAGLGITPDQLQTWLKTCHSS